MWALGIIGSLREENYLGEMAHMVKKLSTVNYKYIFL